MTALREDKPLPTHDLHKFMAQISDEMASEYERIYARAAEDPGTAGDEGEENWATLFREWLPPNYHVATKGRLISHEGVTSPQVDVLVLKPAYPKKLLEKKIWLAGGVAAAFECKNTLKAEHVSSAVQRCVQFKNLYEARTGTPRRELRSPLVYGILAHSHSWKGVNSDPQSNIRRALEAAKDDVTHPRHELDFICVADLSTWQSTYIARYEADWNESASSFLRTAFGGSCGPMTTMICSASSSETQNEDYQPIGGLLNGLTQLMAYSDASIRDIADYYRMANLGGTGAGSMRPWPLTSYSNEVSKKISQNELTNGVHWDEWSVGGF
jgi:hypothetical protein